MNNTASRLALARRHHASAVIRSAFSRSAGVFTLKKRRNGSPKLRSSASATRCALGSALDEARHPKVAASDRALDVGETSRRIRGAERLGARRTLRYRRQGALAHAAHEEREQSRADERHVPRDDDRDAIGRNRRDGGVKTDDAAALRPNVAVNGNTSEPLIGVRRVGDENDLLGHGANRRRHPIDDANAADPSQSLRLAAEPLVRSAGDDGARHSAMRVSGHASPAGSSPAASGLRRSTLRPRVPIRAPIERGRE